jgi:enoyl-CoA hydratase/carnithine racemase
VSTPDVLVETTGSVTFLTFNRPAAKNAMTWAMYDALVEACERIDASPDIRVFVIRAAGEAFGAGTDIRQFAGFTGDDGLAYERRLEACLERLERVAVPTIAQVQGVAAGAGCAIALACDLRVITRAAQFGVPIARTLGNGLSALNCARLLDHFGPARTREMLFTGRLFGAEEAVAAELAARVVEPGELDAAVAELASTIAANAPVTVRALKETLRRVEHDRRPEASLSDDLLRRCYASEDFREGVAAFAAKRKPKFRGN